MSISALDIVAALNVVRQSALTYQEILNLLSDDDLTEEAVQAQLSQTNDSLEFYRDND